MTAVEATVFVGRDAARRRLAAALGRGESTSAVGVGLVVGPPGIGKSTLLAQAVEDRRASVDAVVLEVGGDELEEQVDHGVVDQLLHRLDRPGLDPQTRALPPADVGSRLLQRLDEAAGDRPVLVVVDDVQVADLRSLEALTFAARRLEADRFAVLLATRPEGVARIPAGLIRLVEASGGAVELEGLDLHGVAALAAALHVDLPAGLVATLHRRTAGHPLHLRLLLEQRTVEELAALGDGDGLVPDVPRLIADRLVGGAAGTRGLLEALAVLDRPAEVATAGALVGLTDPFAGAQELVELGLVVRRGAGRIDFRHDLVRAAVLESVTLDRLRDLHRAAVSVTTGAAALRHRVALAHGIDRALAGDLLAEADRQAASGDRLGAANWCVLAARCADGELRSRATLVGADHALAMGRLSGPWRERVDALDGEPAKDAILGRILLTEGRFAEAAVLLERAWELRDAASVRDAAFWSPVAESLAVVGIGRLDPDAVVRWAVELEALGVGSTATTMHGHGLALAGRFAEARRLADERVARERPGEVDADARLARGVVALWSDDLEVAVTDLSAVRVAAPTTSLLQTITACAHLADARLRGGHLLEAADLADHAIELVEDSENLWLMALPHCMASYARVALGDLERARHHAEQVAAYGAYTGDAPAQQWAEAGWLRIAEAEGDHGGVVAAGDRMLAARLDRIPEGINPWRASYAESLAAVGRLDAAASVLDALAADLGLPEGGPPTPGSTPAAGGAAPTDRRLLAGYWRARATLAEAQGDDAATSAALAAGLALDPVGSGRVERARLELVAGVHRLRQGDVAGGRALLETAAARFANLGARRWHRRCLDQLAAAPAPAAVADPAASTTAVGGTDTAGASGTAPGTDPTGLTIAPSAASAPGPADLAAAVSASGIAGASAATGSTAPGRAAPDAAPAATGVTASMDPFSVLTPRERMVSRLVADGCTNQQVAAELVLSVKTVEHHLSRIYAKLGVQSRTQMAALLRRY